MALYNATQLANGRRRRFNHFMLLIVFGCFNLAEISPIGGNCAQKELYMFKISPFSITTAITMSHEFGSHTAWSQSSPKKMRRNPPFLKVLTFQHMNFEKRSYTHTHTHTRRYLSFSCISADWFCPSLPN